MATLAELYQRIEANKIAASDQAFSKWRKAQPFDRYASEDAENMRQAAQQWKEEGDLDTGFGTGFGPGSVDGPRIRQSTLLEGGYVPLDMNNLSYSAAQLGLTIPQLMERYLPGGSYEQEPGGNSYLYKNAGGAPVSEDLINSMPQKPDGGNGVGWKDFLTLAGIAAIPFGGQFLTGGFGAAGTGSFGAGIGAEMGLGGIGLDAAASAAAGYGGAGGAGAGFGALDGAGSLSGEALTGGTGGFDFSGGFSPVTAETVGTIGGVGGGAPLSLTGTAPALNSLANVGATGTGLPDIPNVPTPNMPGAQQAPAPVQNGPTNPGTGPGGSQPPISPQNLIQRLLNGTAAPGDYLKLAQLATGAGGALSGAGGGGGAGGAGGALPGSGGDIDWLKLLGGGAGMAYDFLGNPFRKAALEGLQGATALAKKPYEEFSPATFESKWKPYLNAIAAPGIANINDNAAKQRIREGASSSRTGQDSLTTLNQSGSPALSRGDSLRREIDLGENRAIGELTSGLTTKAWDSAIGENQFKAKYPIATQGALGSTLRGAAPFDPGNPFAQAMSIGGASGLFGNTGGSGTNGFNTWLNSWLKGTPGTSTGPLGGGVTGAGIGAEMGAGGIGLDPAASDAAGYGGAGGSSDDVTGNYNDFWA